MSYFTELLIKNRSYRGFDPSQKISHEDLVSLIKLTRYCPSTSNIQSLRFHIIDAEDDVRRVLEKTRWGGCMRELKLPHPGMEPSCFISIYNDKNITPNSESMLKDVGIVAHTILLRATEMGFGGCMLGCLSPTVMNQIIPMGKNFDYLLLLALGKPTETIIIEEAPLGFVSRDNCFYRDEKGIHHVWKRPYEELFI